MEDKKNKKQEFINIQNKIFQNKTTKIVVFFIL